MAAISDAIRAGDTDNALRIMRRLEEEETLQVAQGDAMIQYPFLAAREQRTGLLAVEVAVETQNVAVLTHLVERYGLDLSSVVTPHKRWPSYAASMGPVVARLYRKHYPRAIRWHLDVLTKVDLGEDDRPRPARWRSVLSAVCWQLVAAYVDPIEPVLDSRNWWPVTAKHTLDHVAKHCDAR